jgi:hypothetical protein
VVDNDGHLIGNLTRRELMRMMLAMEQVEPQDASPMRNETVRNEPARVVPAPRSVQVARKPLATV